MKITLFGAASDSIDNSYKLAAENVGAEIAKRGHTLVFGAGACGVMGAAARGAKAQNGRIVGVVPYFFVDDKVEALFEDSTKTIYTETMNARKQIMENMCDAYIIAPGGIGTFDEFFEVLTNKQLGIEDKPIAVYNFNGFYNELDALINSAIAKNFVKDTCRLLYKITDNLNELFDYIENSGKLGMDVKELKEG